MIFLDIFFKNNVVEIVNNTYTWHSLYSGILIMDIINESAGLITSYYMLDAVVRGMFTPGYGQKPGWPKPPWSNARLLKSPMVKSPIKQTNKHLNIGYLHM